MTARLTHLVLGAKDEKRPGSISNEPGRPEHRVEYRSISRTRGRSFFVAKSLRCHLPCIHAREKKTLRRFSTTSVTGAAIMTEITVAISNCDRSTITAAGGIRLELGKLLIAGCRGFRSGRGRLQRHQRRGHSLCDDGRWFPQCETM